MFEKKLVKKRTINFIMLMSFTFIFALLVMGFVSAAGDVAYIYKTSSKIDDNVLDVFSDMGLNVDLIDEDDIPGDLNGYRFLYVGDERFRNEGRIPIDEYPSIISNYYFGYDWGLTDYDGISKLASNSELNVIKDSEVIQVYTRAKYSNKPISIPYYYLDNENKAPQMEKVAGTYMGSDYDFGDVISYAGAGTDLINGKTTDKKLCFFGIIESDYWTSDARELFEDCVSYVGITCSEDSECGEEDYIGEEFCQSGDVYRNYQEFSCENPGSVQSDCSESIDGVLIDDCDYGCLDGDCLLECYEDADCASNEICESNECVEIVCKEDVDCDDSNDYTLDSCLNPGTVLSSCSNEPIDCIEDIDCEDGNDYTLDICLNPGTVLSSCSHEGIDCFTNSDCDDSDAYTFDECLNPGELDSSCSNEPIECISSDDCGLTGFNGDNFCQGDSVFRNYDEFSCNNPGSKESSCSLSSEDQLIAECSDTCVDGACIDINCYEDVDCDDTDAYTFDTCNNPGTLNSFCSYEDVDCLIDADCDDSNCFTIDSCVNPGEVSSYCSNDIITCLDDSDCGSDGFIGNNFCEVDDVFRNYQEFSCENPGTILSSCSQTVENRLIEDCSDTCVSGGCVDITCYNNLDCDDSNSLTEDVCHNPGEVSSYCTHGDITCFNDFDCGSDMFIGNAYCNGDEVYQDFRSFLCSNPGNSLSSCSDNTVSELIDSCDYACSDGLCVRCNNDGDCDDSNSMTEDVCRFAGSIDSYCENDLIECSSDSECGSDGFVGDGFCQGDDIYKNYREFDCLNPGNSNSDCDSDIEARLFEVCNYGCANGLCIEFTECQDGYDNDDDFLIDAQDPGCWADPLNPLTYDPSLNDESFATSQCQNEIDDDSDILVDAQDPGCWNNLNDPSSYNPLDNDERYGDITCYNDADCDDSDAYTIDSCRNPGLGSSYCINDRIACLENSDCGISGFMGSEFCFVDDVYQNYREFECLNPGDVNAYCSSFVNFQLISECAEECVDGDCVDIVCYNDGDCDDSDAYTLDNCENPGEVNSYCLNRPINCLNDGDCDDSNTYTLDNCENPGTLISYCSNHPLVCLENIDCGMNGYIGDDFCRGDDVYKNYKEFDCLNAGGLGASCNSDVEALLIEECVYGCANGDCFDECSVDIDCGVDSYIGERYCIGDDAYQEYEEFDCRGGECESDVDEILVESCSDTCVDGGCVEITCYNNEDCDDSDAYTIDSCRNPGSVNSYCSNEPIVCIQNNDCGNDGYIGDEFCQGDDVYKNYKEFDCLNAGGLGASCNSDVDALLIEECVYGCVNGDCMGECVLDIDCGVDSFVGEEYCIGDDVYQGYQEFECSGEECSSDVEERLIESCSDTCVDGGCVEIECSSDSECGVNEFLGSEFCEGDSIFDNFITHHCINPGSVQSSCTYVVNPQEVEDCGSDSCEDYSDDYCREGDVYHSRLCGVNGCSNGDCVSSVYLDEELVDDCDYDCSDGECVGECSVDNECGNDGFISERRCVGRDVYREYQDFECSGMECSSSVEDRLIESCSDACSDGVCQDFACSSDSDCGISWEDPFMCIGADVYQRHFNYICNNPGTISSSCTSDSGMRKIADCEHGCSDGSCLTPECISHLDCGESGWIGEVYCKSGDVYREFQEFDCLSGECSDEIDERLVTDCEHGCSNGNCILSYCDDDDFDGYDDCDFGETGDDGREEDCDDRDDEVNPGEIEVCDGKDNDCDGLIDEGVCEICDNGIDDDGDGLIDGLVELSRDNNLQESFGNTAPGTISTLIAQNSEYDLKCPLTGSYGGILRSNTNGWSENIAEANLHVTTEKVCNILGYYDAVDAGCHDGERSGLYPSGKCNYHTPNNNCVFFWDGSTFQYTNSNSAKRVHSWITDLVCKGKIPECSDGKDNDGDGKIDYPEDNGCATPDDNNELRHDDDCD
jgi:hypothetical protein